LFGWLGPSIAHVVPPARRLAPLLLAGVLIAASLGVPLASIAQTDAPADAQTGDAVPRTFAQTGYRIDRDSFYDYFVSRGGVATFGYPVSRDFPFQGCTAQFFQRIVMQQCGNTGVSPLNLLDGGLLPYTRVNGSTFPASDSSLVARTPKVSDPNYVSDMLDFVRASAPDTFDGQQVNFQQAFFNTISPEVAGTDDPTILGLLDLEIWGTPTSAPSYDPGNHNFIYQRFQRGIMHYDQGCECTQGLLLADYLKALITGVNLPADLAAQADASPLLRSAIIAGKQPPLTNYGNAFVPGAGSVTANTPPPQPLIQPTPTPPPVVSLLQPGASPLPPPTAVPSPDYGLSMFLWNEPSTTARDLNIASSANFHWQKTLFEWRQIEGAGKGIYNWTEADRVVKASSASGVKIIARIDFQPVWARKDKANNGPPDNYQDYADFITAFASRYKPGSAFGTVDAIEIWNEVNLTREWGNQPINQQQAADYVRLLTLAYRAAHAANPNIIIIQAGLSPTGVHNAMADDDAEYLGWLFQAGLKGGVNYDVLGAHGNTQAPCVACDFNSLPGFGDPSFYFRRIEQLRDIQVKYGDSDRQIWLLEFGWTADKVHPNYAWYAVSEDQKAANIVQAFQFARQHWAPWIGVMTLWTLSDPNWSAKDEEYWWAISNPDGTPRAALNAVRTARTNGSI
jgi:hypothetical protein